MLIVLFLFFAPAFAADKNCGQIKDHRVFYLCSIEKHPLSKVADMKANEGAALYEQASQWKNPELTVKSVAGSIAGENVGSTELNATVSISQLWQRAPRLKLAEEEKQISVIAAKDSFLNVKKEVIRSMFRWRQIEDEQVLLNETLKTFSTIQAQLRSRRIRGPEQEVTLNLVDLARSDYELKKNQLAIEQLEMLSKMKGIWGSDFEMKKEYLPQPKKDWPSFDASVPTGRSFEVQKVLIEAKKAQSEKSVADAESWPEVTVGPTIERSTQGPAQYYSYGVNFSMTLPLVSLKGGARKLAGTRALEAKFIAEYTERIADLENVIHLKKYNSAVDSLKRSIKKNDLQKRQKINENLFRQGRIPGTLMIEAHRQLNEYLSSQSNHENAAIEAFFEIKNLRGEDIEDIL